MISLIVVAGVSLLWIAYIVADAVRDVTGRTVGKPVAMQKLIFFSLVFVTTLFVNTALIAHAIVDHYGDSLHE